MVWVQCWHCCGGCPPPLLTLSKIHQQQQQQQQDPIIMCECASEDAVIITSINQYVYHQISGDFASTSSWEQSYERMYWPVTSHNDSVLIWLVILRALVSDGAFVSLRQCVWSYWDQWENVFWLVTWWSEATHTHITHDDDLLSSDKIHVVRARNTRQTMVAAVKWSYTSYDNITPLDVFLKLSQHSKLISSSHYLCAVAAFPNFANSYSSSYSVHEQCA